MQLCTGLGRLCLNEEEGSFDTQPSGGTAFGANPGVFGHGTPPSTPGAASNLSRASSVATTTAAKRGSRVFDFSGRMPSLANSGSLIRASAELSLEEMLLREGVSVNDEHFTKTVDELEAEGKLICKKPKARRRKRPKGGKEKGGDKNGDEPGGDEHGGDEKGGNKKGKRRRLRGSQLEESLTVPENSEVRGLTNGANVCYANAVLQCLMVIPEYRDMLLQSASFPNLAIPMALTKNCFRGSEQWRTTRYWLR